MDYLITLLFLIISIVLGISISLFLSFKSYLIIALLCTIIFISLELYYNYYQLKHISTNPSYTKSPEPDTTLTKLVSGVLSWNTPTNLRIPTGTTLTANGEIITTGEKFEDIIITKDAPPELNKPFELSSTNPLDGLQPSELLSRLNYIYYATANPNKVVNYHDFKTHADKYINEDSIQLSTNDTKLQSYSAGFYPHLTTNQIYTHDCLNDGSDGRSCFQSPQLFYNAKHQFNILDKGVNVDNANLIIREDFSINPGVLYMNAPVGNLDRSLDYESNETIDLSGEELALCRTCKLAVCKNDMCSLQNSLFM